MEEVGIRGGALGGSGFSIFWLRFAAFGMITSSSLEHKCQLNVPERTAFYTGCSGV